MYPGPGRQNTIQHIIAWSCARGLACGARVAACYCPHGRRFYGWGCTLNPKIIRFSADSGTDSGTDSVTLSPHSGVGKHVFRLCSVEAFCFSCAVVFFFKFFYMFFFCFFPVRVLRCRAFFPVVSGCLFLLGDRPLPST